MSYGVNGNVARSPGALKSLAASDGAPLAMVALGLLLLWFSFYAHRTVHVAWLEDVDYSHGYLVLALAVWLLVLEVRREPLTAFVPSWLGMAALFGLLVATIAALASTTQFVAHAALPALWIAAIWAAAGSRNACRLALPFLYLYVAMPVWSSLIEPLRRLTVYVVTVWLRAANLPAYIEGNLFHVPSGTYEVQGGCAGLRYAIIAVALAGFGNLLNRRRFAPSALLLAIALVLGLVGNWLRVFITVAVGQSEANNLFTVLVREQHTLFGWLLFAVLMIPLFYLDRILPAGNTAIAAAPTPAEPSAPPRQLAGVYVACALLALGIALNHRIDPGSDATRSVAVAFAAPEVPGWQRVEPWDDARLPQYAGTAAQAASWYADGAARVGAYVAEYAVQRDHQEVVFVGNRPEGEFGTVVARRDVELAAASGVTLPFEELEVTDSAAERRLVLVGVRVAGAPAASALSAKVLQVAGAIRGRRDAQAIVLTAACGDDCSSARSTLSRYAAVAAEPLYEQAEGYSAAGLARTDTKDGIP